MTDVTMKRKVMVLGNELSRCMPRSKAFVAAWKVIKAGGLTLAVKGTSYGSRQEALRRLNKYNPAQIKTVLVPEPENPVDSGAIAVMVFIQGGKGMFTLGYISAKETAVVRALPHQFLNLNIVSGTWYSRGREFVTYGARVTIRQ